MTGKPLNTRKRGVQSAYTEGQVSAIVQAEKDAGKSLRAIAAEYGFPVNHADIERILQGHYPHSAAKRKALHLTPVCVSCGQRVKPVRIVPAWVGQAVENLKALQVQNHEVSPSVTKENQNRVYSRGGKRVLPHDLNGVPA